MGESITLPNCAFPLGELVQCKDCILLARGLNLRRGKSVSGHFACCQSPLATKPFNSLSPCSEAEGELQRTHSAMSSPHSSTDRHQIHARSWLRTSPTPTHSARPSPSFEHIQSMTSRASPSVRRLRRALLWNRGVWSASVRVREKRRWC